jgi:NAD-dependent deacetylase
MPELSEEQLGRAAQLLADARRIVCLTGAGVSAESGISTFRQAQTGLWAQFDPQQLASQEGFAADPGLVWRWYMRRLSAVEQAQPNPGHYALAEIGALKLSFTLVTQNIDDLHERAGSSQVLHLHGRIARFHCNQCQFEHTLTAREQAASQPPRCVNCGGLVRPSVVWFGEVLPNRVLDRAWREAERCDLMLVVGTSGVVYPAAQLPFVARHAGGRVIDINPEETPIAEIADVSLSGLSGRLLPHLVELVRQLQRAAS